LARKKDRRGKAEKANQPPFARLTFFIVFGCTMVRYEKK
jgi:hypothetical protein